MSVHEDSSCLKPKRDLTHVSRRGTGRNGVLSVIAMLRQQWGVVTPFWQTWRREKISNKYRPKYAVVALLSR